MQVGVEWRCRTHTSCFPQSADREHRRAAGKQCMDASGNLYQYDNYDEVAMDTDSEAGSPSKGWACSQLSTSRSASKLCTLLTCQCLHPRMPSCMLTMLDVSRGTLERYVCFITLPNMRKNTPMGFYFHCVISVHQDFSQTFLSTLSTGPLPPPPIPPPPDLLEVPPKPPFADEEEEEEMLLRETCLMSMVSKRVAVTEVCCQTSARAVRPCLQPVLLPHSPSLCWCAGEDLEYSWISKLSAPHSIPTSSPWEPEHRQSEHRVSFQDQQVWRTPASSTSGEN